MNCQACGGSLKYTGGLYICESCGTKQQIASFFEKTEAFICYIESDEQGRRTKDSVVAQDLYNKLESAKINTFYQRVSVAELTGADFKKACTEALDKAKVLIIAGTSKENFEALLEQFKENFEGKKIFPVYSGIDAYNLPKEFSSLQALNYETIGSVNDLIKATLNTLGRENEIDIITEAELKKQKKKKKILLSTGVTVAFILVIGAYIVFATPYVLDSKKYAHAEKLTEKGEYVEAIGIYTELSDYQNSAGALKNIYDKYDGYYFDDAQSIVLHINIIDDAETEVVITKRIGNKSVKAEIKTNIRNNFIEFNFKDNQGNNGNGTVVLQNDGVKLITLAEDIQTELAIGNTDYFFSMTSKSDAPPKLQISQEELISWVTNLTTKKDLFAKGYELERIDSGNIYRIQNTDIEVLIIEFYRYEGEFYDYIGANDDRRIYDEELVRAVSAPAGVLAPQKIGKAALRSIENSVLYVPNAKLWEPNQPMMHSEMVEPKDEVVKTETNFFITAKGSLGTHYWWETISFEIMNKLELTDACNVVGETADVFYVLFNEQYPDERGATSIDSSGTYKLYSLNKGDFEMSLIKEEYYITDPTDAILSRFLGDFSKNCRLCY